MSAAQETVKWARLLHKTFLLTIPLYAFAGERIAHPETAPGKTLLFRIVFLVVAAHNILLALMFRKRTIKKANEVLMRNASDSEALKLWRSGNVLTFTFCEVVALLGFVLRFLGGTLQEAGFFYIVAAAALILWAPRAEFEREM
jgi:hypothetical protein